MKIFSTFPTVNISKHDFSLVICIAKNLIWTTLNGIFSVFLHTQIPIFSDPSKQYINGKLIYSSNLYDWFYGHISVFPMYHGSGMYIILKHYVNSM